MNTTTKFCKNYSDMRLWDLKDYIWNYNEVKVIYYNMTSRDIQNGIMLTCPRSMHVFSISKDYMQMVCTVNI